jgi:guanylate kinase
MEYAVVPRLSDGLGNRLFQYAVALGLAKKWNRPVKFVKAFPETRTLFIVPPSIDEIERRLIARGTETEQSLKTRVKNASSEIKAGIQTDDESFLIGYRMINNNLKDAQKLFMAFFENLYEDELIKTN